MSVLQLEAPALPEIRSRGIVELKTLSDGAPGRFEAIVAVFNNIDSYGDRILPGAFTRTLAERGFPAIVWSHMWFEPPIGASLEAEEIDKGLRVVGQLFTDDNARAREVYAAMKNVGGDDRPPLREFSFAFYVIESRFVEEPIDPANPDAGTREVRELIDLELIEAGPTLVGANSATELLDVATGIANGRKSRRRDSGPIADAVAELATVDLKAGAVLSATNRGHIETAIEGLQKVLADADKEKSFEPAEDADRQKAVGELLTSFPRTTVTV